MRLAEFGAFVDLGGIDGLIHNSELSCARIKHPSEVVKIGDKVQVEVMKFDPEAKKVSLSLKHSLDDPWKTVPDTLHEGDARHGDAHQGHAELLARRIAARRHRDGAQVGIRSGRAARSRSGVAGEDPLDQRSIAADHGEPQGDRMRRTARRRPTPSRSSPSRQHKPRRRSKRQRSSRSQTPSPIVRSSQSAADSGTSQNGPSGPFCIKGHA